MKRMRFGRLNKSDVEALVRIHAAIAAAHTALNQSSWSGRALVINVLEQTDIFISELFNRSERAALASQTPAAAAAEIGDQSVHTASVESNGNLDLNSADKERV